MTLRGLSLCKWLKLSFLFTEGVYWYIAASSDNAYLQLYAIQHSAAVANSNARFVIILEQANYSSCRTTVGSTHVMILPLNGTGKRSKFFDGEHFVAEICRQNGLSSVTCKQILAWLTPKPTFLFSPACVTVQ